MAKLTEAVSAIARLRNGETIPFLFQFLTDKDPKIILQAIRGLLVFKNNDIVKKSLIKLADHPNGIIQLVIRKAFINKKMSWLIAMCEKYLPIFLINLFI